MFTAQEARRLQKESFTLRGRVVDAITAAVKRNESEVVVPRLNLGDDLRRELENKGYHVNGSVISWYEIPTQEKVEMQEALDTIGDGSNPDKEQK